MYSGSFSLHVAASNPHARATFHPRARSKPPTACRPDGPPAARPRSASPQGTAAAPPRSRPVRCGSRGSSPGRPGGPETPSSRPPASGPDRPCDTAAPRRLEGVGHEPLRRQLRTVQIAAGQPVAAEVQLARHADRRRLAAARRGRTPGIGDGAADGDRNRFRGQRLRNRITAGERGAFRRSIAVDQVRRRPQQVDARRTCGRREGLAPDQQLLDPAAALRTLVA